MRALDGNLAALDRYMAELDEEHRREMNAERIAEEMLEAADDPEHRWHGGDLEERELLREHALEILAGKADPPEGWDG